MQGHPGSKKMLYELRKRYCSPNLAIKVQDTIYGCKLCAHSKRPNNSQLKPPLQKIYDPSNGPDDLMVNDLVGPLPASNGFTPILTSIDIFSRYLFESDKGTVFTSELMTLQRQSGNSSNSQDSRKVVI